MKWTDKMDRLNYEVLRIILNNVGHNTCPSKFYNMRIVSKDFRNVIDDYKGGFYFYIRKYLGVENNTYDEYINNKLRIDRPITMKHGFKILHLDDWTLSGSYKYDQLSYPKYEKKNDEFVWVTEGEIVEHKIIDGYIIEGNVYEKYYNIMMKYIVVFDNVKNNKVIKWIKNNEY